MEKKDSNPYFNIFYSFAKGSQKDLESQTALENNISRAFLATLQNLEEKNCIDFFKNLKCICKGFDVDVPKEKPEFRIQSNNKEEIKKKIGNCKNKILLVINGFGEDWPLERNRDEQEKGETIPDGWIFYDNTVICVEAKLLTEPAMKQEDGHFVGWLGVLDEKDRIKKKINWEDIESVSRGMAVEIDNPKNKFILEELADFLNWEGFGKLNKEHFVGLADKVQDKDFNFLKTQLKKLNKYLGKDSLGNDRYEENSKEREGEYRLIHRYQKTSLSLNVCFIKELNKSNYIFYISIYTSNDQGFNNLVKMLNADLFKKLNDKVKEKWKIDLGIAFSNVRLDRRQTKEDWGQSIINHEEISEIENIVESYKTEKKNENKKYYVGKRISISFTFGEDFWVLPTYGKQIDRIKCYLFEIDKILNDMK